MKVLFLDIDGVVNCSSTEQRHRGFIGICRDRANLVKMILKNTGASVVLSSTWRLDKESREWVKKKVCDFIDVTPHMPLSGGVGACERGKEIKMWLEANPLVEQEEVIYAILDDDSDMLPEQQEHFFKTTWQEGLTEDIAKKVEEHLNK